MGAPVTDAKSKLAGIQSELESEKQLTRCHAMQRLVQWVKEDKSVHAAALPMIQAALGQPRDPWVTTLALEGLEVIAGAQEARKVRDLLLGGSNPVIVKAIVLAMRDAGDTPILIELLGRSSDEEVCISAVRMLGRLRGPAALPVLTGLLAKVNLRPHVIEALAEYGDARAMPHLDRYLDDKTEAWPEDNHGPMLRVGDLARQAIERLRYR